VNSFIQIVPQLLRTTVVTDKLVNATDVIVVITILDGNWSCSFYKHFFFFFFFRNINNCLLLGTGWFTLNNIVSSWKKVSSRILYFLIRRRTRRKACDGRNLRKGWARRWIESIRGQYGERRNFRWERRNRGSIGERWCVRVGREVCWRIGGTSRCG